MIVFTINFYLNEDFYLHWCPYMVISDIQIVCPKPKNNQLTII